jgi:site-specific recombinase XerD
VEDLPFGKVDIELIESYARYLKIDLRMSPNTVKINMKPFRTLVKRAFSRKLLRQDPFFDYRYEKSISKRRWVSQDELGRIMKAEITYPSVAFTRDMFVFACFTGISYADLNSLKHVDIHSQPDGSRMILIERQKTGVASCIPLLPAAQDILEKYRNSRFAGLGGKVFRMQTLSGMDRHLKYIAKSARIDKCLTFHMGRHTYATTVCLSNGIPIESLSRMLGHSSISTTQIYAEVTRMKINEDMTNLGKRIEGKYRLADNEFKQQK